MAESPRGGSVAHLPRPEASEKDSGGRGGRGHLNRDTLIVTDLIA